MPFKYGSSLIARLARQRRQREANHRYNAKFTYEQLKERKLGYRYGLTLAQAKELYSRPCELCGRKLKVMHIDHAHIDGKQEPKGTFRGVLCVSCNQRLGWFEKRQEQVLVYLQRNNKPYGQ